ncbi:uncharacterized protein YjeT (DUF2065 family) [Xanthobacter agilis]|jgi:hypothetical protein|uniref:Uncharacterized protein YjeT (DUF2065 family) n=1 Tax=Xanthobacter agilis TaxID=47492 RepID=A0ABU0LG17_XANAG|nr:uncharacterized protein YjeT (DUF2065 family) [Xanthobacter agilis]
MLRKLAVASALVAILGIAAFFAPHEATTTALTLSTATPA